MSEPVSAYEGYFDQVLSSLIFGWGWRSDLPSEPISVDLYVDDVYQSTVVANLYRADLEMAEKGNGRHAFEIKLPDRFHDGKAHTIRLFYRGTNIELIGSPQTVSVERKTALVQADNSPREQLPSGELARQRLRESSDRPKVSVIISCCNLGACLDQAVQSVLDQTFQDFEIIIVDDGSTDPTTCHLFASYRRPKTRILHTSNQGSAKAKNLGISEGKGNYVCCLDADDILEPTYLEKAVQVLDDNPSLTFASCRQKAVGDSTSEWTPTLCEFPHLLVEDRVCTAAMTRREALLDLGGFDSSMPVTGYEDWDLAISLVERGLHGTIFPEFLVNHRAGSMGSFSEEVKNDAVRMRYVVEKHSESYRTFLTDVLELMENRISELASVKSKPSTNETQARRIDFLEDRLDLVLRSRSWTVMRPARLAWSRVNSRRSKRAGFKYSNAPAVCVVLTCRDQGRELPACLGSVRSQLSADDEIIIVDDGSTDLVTLQMLDWYRESGLEIIHTAAVGLVKAREIGLKHARGKLLFALNADQSVGSGYIQQAVGLLNSRADVVYVACGRYDEKIGFGWIPQSASVHDLIGCDRVPFPIVRREALAQAGGYDPGFDSLEQADWELVLRLSAGGRPGELLNEALVVDRSVNADQKGASAALFPTVKAVIEKQRQIFDVYWKEAILGSENQRHRLQAHLQSEDASQNGPAIGSINWGDLRRVEPISPVWGFDRGQPVDRYYIARFLERHQQDIRGRILEVKDAGYSRAYGSMVDSTDIVDIAPDNASATLVCDLSSRESLPESRYNCFIITQTIHIIYEIRNVIENAFRTLRPGGVLLATLPCVSRIDYESGLEQDQWRFTPASARRLFEEYFGRGQVDIQSHGNVLACSSFLMGLSAHELTPEELNHGDPYFPLLITVRAAKAQQVSIPAPRGTVSEPAGKAVVVMYHRIDRPLRDRWHLCVSPENFAAHMRCLRRSFNPVRLAEIVAMIDNGKVKQDSVAVTFDDGYRDNLTTAIPIIREWRVPATFFISGDGAAEGHSFWWEFLAGSLEIMNLDSPAARELHQTLMAADVEERTRILAELPHPENNLPQRLSHDELKLLAYEGLADIGAHGWSHRLIAPLSIDGQREEILKNVRHLNDLTRLSMSCFAYPFGGPVTAETKNVLRETGITAACTVDNKAVTGDCDPLMIPRVEVGDWEAEEFEDRLRSVLAS